MTKTSDRFLLMRIKQRNAQSRMDKLARQLHSKLSDPNHHADDTKQIEHELRLAQARKQAAGDKKE